jgi:hypothetical protein
MIAAPGLNDAMTIVDRLISPLTATRRLLRVGPCADAEAFAAIRRRLVLDCCKWDPQVGDVSTLAPFPLVVPACVWRQLADWAERLSAEAALAELELLLLPESLDCLGLPRRIRSILSHGGRRGITAAAARVTRFDFHLTSGSLETGGWQISEANSDVPGGFTEASSFPQLMAGQFAGLCPAGDPAGAWADAVCARVGGEGGIVAMLCCAGYMEDQEVMAYLAGRLRARGLRTRLADPRQLRWQAGAARLDSGDADASRPLAAVARFYQGEWLAGLPRKSGWEHFFVGGRTPVANPGIALLTESKRFPLAWDAAQHRCRFRKRLPGLRTPLPTWRKLLPETRDPRDAPWERDDGWVLKPAFGNTGDHVAARDWPEKPDGYAPRRGGRWCAAAKDARRHPGAWVAQRRFDCVPLLTPLGEMWPCIGVYTVDGSAAGAYGRLSPGPLIDYAAVDTAVLVEGSAGI